MKFSTIYKIATLAAITAAVVGCKKDPLEQPETKGEPMVFTAGVAELTKSQPLENDEASALFLAGDMIAATTGEERSYLEWTDYSTYAFSGSSWDLLDGQLALVWPVNVQEGSTSWFRAYYPVNDNTYYESFELPSDQSSVSLIAAADYMKHYDSEQSYVKGGTISLPMQRRTARVIIEVEYAKDQEPTIALDNLKIHSAFSEYAWEEEVPSGASLEINPFVKAADPDAGTNATYTALVLPTGDKKSSAGNFLDTFITFTANGIGDVLPGNGPKNYTKSLVSPQLEAGYSYTFKLVVTAEEIYLDPDAVIEDWKDKDITGGDVPVHTYYLYDEQDLLELAQLVNEGGHSEIIGILMNDITISESTQWIPIGKADAPFAGVFKSDESATATHGYAISGFKINNTKENDHYQGFFGYVDGTKGNNDGAEITKITINAGSVTASNTSNHVGTFAGYLSDVSIASSLVNSTNATVSGGNNVGGLVGTIGGVVELTNSPILLNNINVTSNVGTENVGGLAGAVLAGDNIIAVPNHMTIKITADKASNVGGVVGYLGGTASLSMENAVEADEDNGTTFAPVIVGANNTGGVIGLVGADASATISQTWTSTSSTITGASNVGGIIGKTLSKSTLIQAVRNDATVLGTNNIGGLVGVNGGDIVASYNTGRILHVNATGITYASAEELGSTIMGGIAGEVVSQGRIVGCFNVGEVLVKAVAAHTHLSGSSAVHEDVLFHTTVLPTTNTAGSEQYFGFKGDGIVGEIRATDEGALEIPVGDDGGTRIYHCYYNDGAIDNDIDNINPMSLDINNYAMTNTGLGNNKAGASGQMIAPLKNMNTAITAYYSEVSLEQIYMLNTQIAGMTSATAFGQVEDYPYITSLDYRYLDNTQWGGGITELGTVYGGKHSGPNSVNVIHPNDALVLISAIALKGMGLTVTDQIKEDYKNTYAPFYVDVNVLVDLDIGGLKDSGYDSRVVGGYFGTFNGHHRYISNYTGTLPFFSELTTTVNGEHSFIGTFKNVTFVNPQVSGSGSNNVGAILGKATFGTVIDSCHIVDGFVMGKDTVGAIVGDLAANITNCTVSGTTRVTGNNVVGGLAGYVELTRKESQSAIVGMLAAEGKNVFQFGNCKTNANVVATGIAGGMVGQSSSDMDAESFNIEAFNVSFTGSVSGNIVGSIAGIMEIAQPKFGFHGVENTGTVIATGANPIVGGMVGIGRIIKGGSLTNEEAGTQTSISALTLYGNAVANTGTADGMTGTPAPSGTIVMGGIIGKLDNNGIAISSVTSTMNGGYERVKEVVNMDGTTAEITRFIPFMGNIAEISDEGVAINDTFKNLYVNPLPILGATEAPDKYYDGKGLLLLQGDPGDQNFTDTMKAINAALSAIPSPFRYNEATGRME